MAIPVPEKVQAAGVKSNFAYFALVFEFLMVVLFAIFIDYDASNNAENDGKSGDVARYYSTFQDVHVMIFIGFGFLMTFLSKYGFGAVGLNFLLAALSIQWGIFLVGAFHWLYKDHYEKIALNMVMLIEGDFAAGAVLITFGALLGKTSPLQMLAVVFFELIFYNLNFYIGALKMQAADMGGSMFVHSFGAYFGLGAAWILGRERSDELTDNKRNSSSKESDTFAMIGSVFLWMFWPSFNGALAGPESQHRVIINTVVALTGSCVGAFLFSQILRGGKFSMVDIQNATLAGGVAIGSSADLVVKPWAAIVIGIIASGVSVYGYTVITPMLEEKFKLFDTCGVHNLHGMPGVIGGTCGAIACACVGDEVYGKNLGSVYAAREDGRSAAGQAGVQLMVLGITVGIAGVSGMFTGLIIRAEIFEPVSTEGLFSDHLDWDEVEEEEGEPSITKHHDVESHGDCQVRVIKVATPKSSGGENPPSQDNPLRQAWD